MCRVGHGVDATASLRQHGLADPALLASGTACPGGAARQPLLTSFGTWGQRHQQALQQPHNRRLTPCSMRMAATASQTVPEQQQQQHPRAAEHACVDVITAVWRAGLAGAATDHSSICFSVDLTTGALSPGVTANHWYRLGLQGLGRVDAAAGCVWQSHPDTDKQVAGELARCSWMAAWLLASSATRPCQRPVQPAGNTYCIMHRGLYICTAVANAAALSSTLLYCPQGCRTSRSTASGLLADVAMHTDQADRLHKMRCCSPRRLRDSWHG